MPATQPDAGHDDAGEARRQQRDQRRLRQEAEAHTDEIDGAQRDDQQRGDHARAVRAERQQRGQMIGEQERGQRDPAGVQDREARPREDEAEPRAVGRAQEVIVAAGMRKGRRHLGEAQRADHRQQAAGDPQHVERRFADVLRDARCGAQDVGGDDHA
jgi:hypothetical protein